MLKLDKQNKIPGDSTVLGGSVSENSKTSKGGGTKVQPGLGDTKNKYFGGSVVKTCEDDTKVTTVSDVQFKGGKITPITIGAGSSKGNKSC
jgi:hypothetical protein